MSTGTTPAQDLQGVLSSHLDLQPALTTENFADLSRRLEQLVGPPPPRTFSNLQALIVSSLEDDEDLSNLALLALRVEEDEALPYAEIPKVVL